MHRLTRHLLGLLALVTPCPALAGSVNVQLETTGTPPGFDNLASTREVLVDVYFGGRKVGEAFAVVEPGVFRFRSARRVAAMVPEVLSPEDLAVALGAELPTHSERICSSGNATDCGVVTPDVVAIIYNDARFRVDLFINPRFLRTADAVNHGYLPLPDAPLGLTSSMGASIAGSTTAPMAYNLQNRTIVGMRNARVRINSSLASDIGFVIDDFVAELDDSDLRYSAGLFWAPGNDFIGQRRVIGGGVGTQFDTRLDRETLHGTPMVVFLAQPARVELVIDGRLVSSRAYAAGNNALDTSALPSGSYTVLLRVHEAGGAVREEQRFYVKSMSAPPVGHPVFYAFAGMLANTRRHRPISASDTLYYQAGAAWRIDNGLAVDAALLGTQHKGVFQVGAWLIRPQVRVRVAGLASSAGDAGALLQLSSGGRGPLNFNFDLRRIMSRDGKPLIPAPSFVDSFRATPSAGLQLAEGSYTQATGSVGFGVGAARLSIVASYRKDKGGRADYSVGPSVNWPVVTGKGFQIVLDASAQRTRTTTAAFAGARLLFTSGRLSMLGTLGHASQNERGAHRSSESRMVGDLNAQYSYEDKQRTLAEIEAGANRNVTSTTIRAGGAVHSRFGNARGDVLHGLDGEGGTQFGMTLQSGMAISSHSAILGGRDLEPSALVVEVKGDARNAEFDILIDDAVRGTVSPGQRFSMFVPGYRVYTVRLRPTTASSVSYDSAPRVVTLYPGNVQTLVWTAQSYFTMFAQAMAADGRPIANALVRAAKTVAETDADGYFQIDIGRNDPITITEKSGASCRLAAPKVVQPRNDFASVGKVLCQ